MVAEEFEKRLIALYKIKYIIFLLLIVVSFFVGCEELDILLSYRTPVALVGTPEIFTFSDNASVTNGHILKEQGWGEINLFDEFPAQFAIRTGAGESVQILMEDEGILDIAPKTFVKVLSYKNSDIKLIDGKCSFYPLKKRFISKYRSSSSTGKIALINSFKKNYLEQKKGLLSVKKFFIMNAKYSSIKANKGNTFSIQLESNHLLKTSKFKLANLDTTFHKVGDKKKFSDYYKFLAVTGLDIYENRSDLKFRADAIDFAGNWIKINLDIPTVAFKFSLMKGKRVYSQKGDTNSNRFAKRYIKILKKSLKKKHRSYLSYKRKIARENRQISFWWKSKRVARRGSDVKHANKIYHSMLSVASKKKLWAGKFIIPTFGVITSGFGKYRHYYGGYSAHHKGIDIAASVGASIRASNSGKVVFVGKSPAQGRNILIDHGLGVYSCFFHLSEYYVKKGDMVKKGDIVGAMGNTGLSTGSHLHWGMSVNGRWVNPMNWVNKNF